MIRENRFNVSTGVIEVNYPDGMTVDDVQDFKDAMAITFRILERTATRESPDEDASCKSKLPQLVEDDYIDSGWPKAVSI